MPAGGSFCTTWNFDAVSVQYQFSQGKFVATTVPEPGTLGFLMIGMVSIAGVIRICTPGSGPQAHGGAPEEAQQKGDLLAALKAESDDEERRYNRCHG
jgi:hypothetical protein